MIRPMLPVLILLYVVSFGCAATAADPAITINGFIAKAEDSTKYAYVDLRQTWIDTSTIRTKLDPSLEKNNTLKTSQYVSVSVAQGEHGIDYTAFLGPSPIPDPAEPKAGSAVLRLGSEASYRLAYGWIYLTGEHPKADTAWLSAGGIGSDLLVQIDAKKQVHRVYMISAHTCWYRKAGLQNTTEFNGPMKYIEMSSDRKVTGPLDLNAQSDAWPFYQKVKEIVDIGKAGQ